MSTNRSADFSDQLMPGIRHTVILNMRRPTEFSRIFNMRSSMKRDEIDSLVTGFGAMPKKGEGIPIFYDAALEGPRTTYVHESFGLGFRVTEETIDDELYGHIKKLPKNLATSGMQTVEVTAANLFNSGFSTVTGADGVSLFNTAHPLVGGGTASGRATWHCLCRGAPGRVYDQQRKNGPAENYPCPKRGASANARHRGLLSAGNDRRTGEQPGLAI